MPLQDISDASLSKLYACLVGNPREIARFARTKYRFSKFAKVHACLRMKALDIEICHHKDKQLLRLTLSLKDYNDVHEFEFDVIDGVVIPIMRELLKHLPDEFISFNDISFMCIDITKEMISLFRETLLVFTEQKHFKQLTFECCKFDCTAEDLIKTGQHLKVKKLALSGIQTKRLNFDTMNLSMLDYDVYIGFEDVYLGDNDDQILTNWLYNMPRSIEFNRFKSKITLEGFLSFIEKFTTKIMSQSGATQRKHEIIVGEVITDDNSTRKLCLAQRNPLLRWVTSHRAWVTNNIISYKVHLINYNICFGFDIVLKAYCKVTKQQARRNIGELMRKIRERRQEEGAAFVLWNDVDIRGEMYALGRQTYQNWDEIKWQITYLLLMRPEEMEEDNQE